jgi:hypothetical protein
MVRPVRSGNDKLSLLKSIEKLQMKIKVTIEVTAVTMVVVFSNLTQSIAVMMMRSRSGRMCSFHDSLELTDRYCG